MTADAISLSFPRGRPYHGVARLVVGGLAARLDFSYEHLEDLQLALASVLERDVYLAGEEVIVELVVREDSVGMAIGPLDGETLRAELDVDPEGGISLSRLLSNLVEEVSLDESEGAYWLRLEKRVPMSHPEPRGPVA